MFKSASSHCEIVAALSVTSSVGSSRDTGDSGEMDILVLNNGVSHDTCWLMHSDDGLYKDTNDRTALHTDRNHVSDVHAINLI